MTDRRATTETSTPDAPPRTQEGAAEVQHPQPTARQQVSAYTQGSVANMLRSMLVIGALMALFVVMAPRLQPDHSGVNALETAQQLHDTTGLAVSAPSDLPDGWVATRAEYRRGADNLMTWHALFETPDGAIVALNQAEDVTDTWVAQTVNRTERIGETEVAGAVWEQYERTGTRPQRSFVDRAEDGALSTVVTGDAPWVDLETFVTALQPVTD